MKIGGRIRYYALALLIHHEHLHSLFTTRYPRTTQSHQPEIGSESVYEDRPAHVHCLGQCIHPLTH